MVWGKTEERLGEEWKLDWGEKEERVVKKGQWGRQKAAKAHLSGRGISKVFGKPTFLTWKREEERVLLKEEKREETGLGFGLTLFLKLFFILSNPSRMEERRNSLFCSLPEPRANKHWQHVEPIPNHGFR